MQLHYKVYGEQNHTSIIILHGLFGSSDNWMRIANHLSAQYCVYLLDQRNHGDSPWSAEWNYQHMSQDLLEFIQSHQIEKPIIIGHSMGGKTAMFFAALYPEIALQKLIIVDIAPKAYPVHHDKIIEGLRALKIDTYSSRKEADQALSAYIKIPAVRQFLLKNLDRQDTGGFRWKINLPVIDREIEAVGEALPSSARAEVATLFIRGEKSDYILDEDEALIAQYFPNAQIQTIAKAGHWVHAEQAQAFLEVLAQFLAK